MTGAWAACMLDDVAPHLGRIRLAEGVQAASQGEEIWLRGTDRRQAIYDTIRQIPRVQRFRVDDQDRLYPEGRRLPQGRLPRLRWVALREFVVATAQEAGYTPPAVAKLPLRLVRATRAAETTANVLVTTAAVFRAWASVAPAFRLEPLSFAADAEGRVMVFGTPLPPIAGRRFVLADQVAVPSGYGWSPDVPAAVVRQVLRLAPGELAIATDDGVHRLAREHIVPATRSAVRRTCPAPTAGD